MDALVRARERLRVFLDSRSVASTVEVLLRLRDLLRVRTRLFERVRFFERFIFSSLPVGDEVSSPLLAVERRRQLDLLRALPEEERSLTLRPLSSSPDAERDLLFCEAFQRRIAAFTSSGLMSFISAAPSPMSLGFTMILFLTWSMPSSKADLRATDLESVGVA